MSITTALNSAISGLTVSQSAIDVISTNVANASVAGYTAKTLTQQTVVIDGTAVGVTAGKISRSVDTSLQAAAIRQISTASYYDIRGEYLKDITNFLGSAQSETAISSQLGDLKDAFSDLSTNPSSPEQLAEVLSSANSLANTFNSYSDLLNGLREDTESDIVTSLNDINIALNTINDLNEQITRLTSTSSSTADLEDQRDAAVKTVAQYLDISTYYEDTTLVVITSGGTSLVDDNVHELSFNQSNMTPTKYYPGGGLSGIMIEGKDITDEINEGELGALIELRDETIPEYQAQLDELAQEVASRFAAEGLTLFTTSKGAVPADGTNYTGFAGDIQVNAAVMADPSLIRNGTTGDTLATGSNEVINRVLEYTFGEYAYQEAQGTTDISSATDLNTLLGITTNNRVTGTTNLSGYSDFSALTNNTDFPADLDITLGSTTITVTIDSTDDVNSLVSNINSAASAAGITSTVATINSEGAIAFNYDGDITISSNALGPSSNDLDAIVLQEMGLDYGSYAAPDATFTIQVGYETEATISIEAGDTSSDLLAKINAVDGVTATLDANGYLVITPDNGGSVSLLDKTGNALELMGVTVSNVSHTAFASTGLGGSGTVSTGLSSTNTLTSYASRMVAKQSTDASLATSQYESSQTYLETIQTEIDSKSGVNVDEQMAELIKMQAVYSASAKIISNITDLLDELLSVV